MVRRRRWSSRLWVVCFAVVPALSCNSATEPDTVRIDATVEFLALEGGCWTLVGTDGARYEPVNLAGPFRQDGLEVLVTLKPLDEVASVCQVGEIVEIESIRPRD